MLSCLLFQYFNEYYTTEHNRLLNLWRDVVAVKRMFCEMQAATQRDLNKMQSEISLAARDVAGTCSGMQTRAAISALAGVKRKFVIKILFYLTMTTKVLLLSNINIV